MTSIFFIHSSSTSFAMMDEEIQALNNAVIQIQLKAEISRTELEEARQREYILTQEKIAAKGLIEYLADPSPTVHYFLKTLLRTAQAANQYDVSILLEDPTVMQAFTDATKIYSIKDIIVAGGTSIKQSAIASHNSILRISGISDDKYSSPGELVTSSISYQTYNIERTREDVLREKAINLLTILRPSISDTSIQHSSMPLTSPSSTTRYPGPTATTALTSPTISTTRTPSQPITPIPFTRTATSTMGRTPSVTPPPTQHTFGD
jgi:hypothetical protein